MLDIKTLEDMCLCLLYNFTALTDSPVLAVAADNTQEHRTAANNQPANTRIVDNTDVLSDVSSLAGPPPEGRGPPGPGRREPQRGGGDDDISSQGGPPPEGRGGGGGRGPPGPGRRGPQRGGGDGVSSLAGPSPEGRGGEGLHVRGRKLSLFSN